jgi:hypothetical protein
MNDQELISLLKTASQAPDIKNNIPLSMLLLMAAERIAEQSSTWKEMKENVQ